MVPYSNKLGKVWIKDKPFMLKFLSAFIMHYLLLLVIPLELIKDIVFPKLIWQDIFLPWETSVPWSLLWETQEKYG